MENLPEQMLDAMNENLYQELKNDFWQQNAIPVFGHDQSYIDFFQRVLHEKSKEIWEEWSKELKPSLIDTSRIHTTKYMVGAGLATLGLLQFTIDRLSAMIKKSCSEHSPWSSNPSPLHFKLYRSPQQWELIAYVRI